MNSQEIRKKFLSYFKNLQHTIVKSDSLIPSSDPTLLFTSAGMVQFKDNFLGLRKDLRRATSVQKCFRTSDIERVGHTFRHLTFFEMLGNFSFGDYFKKEAIEWAWDFLTKECGLDKKKLFITIYKNDDEALNIWSKIVNTEKIYKLGDETNFWRMGDRGPCGPCSEILYDLGKEYGCNKPSCSPACDCDRYLEVWNLVFTQFDCQQDGSLKPLLQKNIDTGMGLERLNMVINGKRTVFDTDIFVEIRKELLKYFDVDEISKKISKLDNYINAIVDHSRAVTFVGSEGILPSNEGRGYVFRKVVRRGLRYAKLLGINKPILHKLVPIVVEVMKNQYPEIELHREKVAIIVKTEEEKFLETLDRGLEKLEEIINLGKKVVSGREVFKLYDTYGFPEELVKEILAEHEMYYDIKEFIQASQEAKNLSRTSWKGVDAVKSDLYKQFPITEFLGYEKYSCESTILGIIKNNTFVNFSTKGDIVFIITDKTPFYGESGGQVGDTGYIKSNIQESKILAEIEDTKKFENRIIHFCKILDTELKIGDKVILEINVDRRKNIMRHHTATHLLHKALRTVLGSHAIQSGSLVSDEYFRFDFIHYKQLTDDEIVKIESIVNEKIMECLEVKIHYADMREAKQLGAMALFEEKYGDIVRVVSIGSEPFSVELCGGTHCKNTGEIGMFKILAESSLGTNLRRIEAVCGKKVYEYFKKREFVIEEISEMLNTDVANIKNKIEKLLKQSKDLIQELNNAKLQMNEKVSEGIEKKVNDYLVIIKKVSEFDGNMLRTLSDKIIDKYIKTPAIIVLYTKKEEKISLVLRITKIALEKNFSLENISKKINQELNIKTGGRKDFVQGGGKLFKDFSEQDLLMIIEKSL